MKIGIASDVHLEFGPLLIPNDQNIDVLVLSGDICVVDDLYRWPAGRVVEHGNISHRKLSADSYRAFFQHVSNEYPHVIYVMGNHEYYHGTWEKTGPCLREELALYSNIHLLEKDVHNVDDVTFIGTSLWTDCNQADPLTCMHLRQCMNDFSVIRVEQKNYASLTPQEIATEHARCLRYIEVVIENQPNDKFVVCTHHSPSKRSIHPKYANDHLMNGGYSSDLDQFIMDRPQIKLWTHGHTHEKFDYLVEQTRVVCNPRGYFGYEIGVNDVYKPHVIEI